MQSVIADAQIAAIVAGIFPHLACWTAIVRHAPDTAHADARAVSTAVLEAVLATAAVGEANAPIVISNPTLAALLFLKCSTKSLSGPLSPYE